MASTAGRLVGNRLALFGAVLYFGEWIGIAIAPGLPTEKLGVDPGSIVAAYLEDPPKTAFLAAWLALVIPGRIIFCIGLRDSLRQSPRSVRLADVAVGVMVVSVTVEVVAYGLVATGAWLAKAGSAPDAVVALDAANSTLFNLIIVPLGTAVFAGSLAMLLSGLFARWLAWFGIVTGALLVVGTITSSTTMGSGGTLYDLGRIPIPLFWIWIIITGVVLFRAAPRRERATTPAP